MADTPATVELGDRSHPAAVGAEFVLVHVEDGPDDVDARPDSDQPPPS